MKTPLTLVITGFYSRLVQTVCKFARNLRWTSLTWCMKYFIQQHGTRACLVPGGSVFTTVGFSSHVVSNFSLSQKWQNNWSGYIAFHSALILLGTIQICKSRGSAVKLPSYDIVRLTPYPSRAVQILYRLDSGNRMVDRCRYYLERYTILSDLTGIVLGLSPAISIFIGVSVTNGQS